MLIDREVSGTLLLEREGRITSSQLWGVAEEGMRLHQNRGLNVSACKCVWGVHPRLPEKHRK